MPDYNSTSYRYNDPPYVKVKKLEVLTEVCNIDNAQNVVDELGWDQQTTTACDVVASLALFVYMQFKPKRLCALQKINLVHVML